MANESNVLNNLYKIIYWVNQDNDRSIQVLESKELGKKLYFRPGDSDLTKHKASGLLFPDKKNAMIVSGYEDGLRALPTSEDLFSVQDLVVDAIEINTFVDSKTGNVMVGSDGFGKYKNGETDFLDEVLELLEKEDLTFHSILRDEPIDYQFEPETEQELLKNALAYSKYVNRNWDDSYYNMTSPVTGDKTMFYVLPLDENAPATNAAFMLFPSEESRDEMIYRNEHPEDNINEDFNYLYLEIYSKEGKLKTYDIPMGKFKNLSEEERREIIKKFYSILKDVYDYGIAGKS